MQKRPSSIVIRKCSVEGLWLSKKVSRIEMREIEFGRSKNEERKTRPQEGIGDMFVMINPIIEIEKDTEEITGEGEIMEIEMGGETTETGDRGRTDMIGGMTGTRTRVGGTEEGIRRTGVTVLSHSLVPKNRGKNLLVLPEKLKIHLRKKAR